VWHAPSEPPLVLEECPSSYIQGEALAMVQDFWLSRHLRRPPMGGGLYGWPARLVDAWAVLTREHETWRRRQKEESA
jgi:hypothetical protein